MGLRSPVFISYAHEDENYLNKILTHLEPLRMQDQVCTAACVPYPFASQLAHQHTPPVFATISAVLRRPGLRYQLRRCLVL